MIHPVLNIESSPTLVQPSYYRERFQDEPDSNTDSKKLYNTRIIANGYVLLHDMASQKRD